MKHSSGGCRNQVCFTISAYFYPSAGAGNSAVSDLSLCAFWTNVSKLQDKHYCVIVSVTEKCMAVETQREEMLNVVTKIFI